MAEPLPGRPPTCPGAGATDAAARPPVGAAGAARAAGMARAASAWAARPPGCCPGSPRSAAPSPARGCCGGSGGRCSSPCRSCCCRRALIDARTPRLAARLPARARPARQQLRAGSSPATRDLPADADRARAPRRRHVRTAKDGTIEYRFAGKPVDTFDVWHERQNEVPGSVVGMSPITAAARALGITSPPRTTAPVLRRGAAPLGAAQQRRADRRGPGEDRQSAGAGDAAGPRTARARRQLEVLGRCRSAPPTPPTWRCCGTGETSPQLFDVPGELIDANTSQGSS
jgi:hypothetical protein